MTRCAFNIAIMDGTNTWRNSAPRARNHREFSLIPQANHTMPVVKFRGGSLVMSIFAHAELELLAFAED